MDFDGPYYIEHGDLWIRDDGPALPGLSGAPRCKHVCSGNEEVAIAFDSDDGTLHKRGKADWVQAWTNETRRKLASMGFDDLARSLTVISFPVTPETVVELNACAQISGRVLKLADNLSRLLDTNSELLSTPRHPAH